MPHLLNAKGTPFPTPEAFKQAGIFNSIATRILSYVRRRLV
jgi:hypothetical protein